MLIHWSHNLHSKSFRDIGAILNSWDEEERWDLLSWQEIVGDDGMSNADEVRIIKEMGKGKHTVALSPMRRGTYRVAVVVHRRLAPYIQQATYAPGGRTVSIIVKIGNRKVQVVSSHLPSTMGHSTDEFCFHLQEFAELLRGHRRHCVLVGMDANTRISQAEAGVTGTALRSSCSSSSLTAAERTNMDSLVAESSGSGLRILNTFEEWWAPHFMRQECITECAAAGRSTWSGPIFTTRTSRCIDYLFADKETARRAAASAIRTMSYPSDHKALYTAYDMGASSVPVLHRRAPRKAIGWWPRDVEKYDADVRRRLAHRGTLGPSRIVENLLEAAAQNRPCHGGG